MASHKLNANIDNENNSPFKEGFLDVPFINAANTNPAPIAPPPKPIVANPAPINFAPATIFFYTLLISVVLNYFCFLPSLYFNSSLTFSLLTFHLERYLIQGGFHKINLL